MTKVDYQPLLSQLVKFKTLNSNRLNKLKRRYASSQNISMLSNAELLKFYKQSVKANKLPFRPEIEELLKKRAIRTLSGVAPIAVLTKPYTCLGKCAFCPTEKEMPKSYLSNEPAVMRAILCKFSPYKQVKSRIDALEKHGHNTDKIELIVMGGTFSHLPHKYQNWFIKKCFDACNKTLSTTLQMAQKKNETAKHRIVGLTLETRPDCIDEEEIKRFRNLGCTKVEIGVQAIDDKILSLNKRKITVEQIIYSTQLLKESGFKIVYHIMPNLPGSTPSKDLKMFKTLFSNSNFQPDMLKIYPTVVTKGSLLYKWWQQGKYKPYSDKVLFNLLIKMKLSIPYYVRIIRLIRDIPKESIVAGNLISNLRQNLKLYLEKENLACKCLRCREARANIKDASKAKLFIEKYAASNGQEYFLHYSSPDKRILYAFLRLRLNNKKNIFLKELTKAALIREVHTYGQLVNINKTEKNAVQHLGFGKKLMAEAEKIAINAGYEKIAVISGIGVRNYYRKLKYKKTKTYMIKRIVHNF
jgi:elongator complex protein 3